MPGVREIEAREAASRKGKPWTLRAERHVDADPVNNVSVHYEHYKTRRTLSPALLHALVARARAPRGALAVPSTAFTGETAPPHSRDSAGESRQPAKNVFTRSVVSENASRARTR
jgi:hypothetical protein